MEVTYSENKKHAYFNGETFTRDENTGYYLTTRNHDRVGRRLHRVVWEYHNHEIPKGCDIHHIDMDKGNNDISNLVLLTSKEHNELHGRMLTEEEREWRRNNLKENARPKAIEWHKTEAGKEWHKKRYEETKDLLHAKETFTCEMCGKEFVAVRNGSNRFCSNACKSKWRRKSGLDNEKRICIVCGKEFETNKYAKTKCCSRSCGIKSKHITEGHNVRF